MAEFAIGAKRAIPWRSRVRLFFSAIWVHCMMRVIKIACHPDPELAEGEGPLHRARTSKRPLVCIPPTSLKK
jgi:hypothetical protein